MIVLGIDPGTAITGYGIVQELPDGRLQSISHGVIRTSSKIDMPNRLVILYKELTKIVSEFQPESCAVEKIFFSKNVKTAISVGQGRGVVLLALAQGNMEVGEYTPNEIKQSITGYGSADKRQMQEMVKVLLKLDDIPKPDDAADALGVAICHIHHQRYQQLMQQ
jgi:crossover junction endodeoxyribonuclease RuvC